MTSDGAKVKVVRRHILSATEEVRPTPIGAEFSPGICELHDYRNSIYDSGL